MSEFLFIDCCIRNRESRTKQIADAFFQNLSGNNHVETLKLIDLDLRPLVNDAFSQRQTLLENKEFTHPRFNYAWQFSKADVIVIAAPFWDLSFPALLKIYIENISVDGITFTSTSEGLKGLCKASDLLFFTSRGGFYRNSKDEQATPYLKSLCIMFGIDNFSCIDADGMDIQGFNGNEALKKACAKAGRLAKTF